MKKTLTPTTQMSFAGMTGTVIFDGALKTRRSETAATREVVTIICDPQ